jgi:hypothetical protein
MKNPFPIPDLYGIVYDDKIITLSVTRFMEEYREKYGVSIDSENTTPKETFNFLKEFDDHFVNTVISNPQEPHLLCITNDAVDT